MLDALRRGATGLVAKLFLGLLILSFAVWGVADVFRGYGQNALATVGKSEITPDEFQRAFQNRLDAISRQFGRRFTPQMARSFGLDQQVLSQLIAGRALDAHASGLGLALPDSKIAELIQSDELFKGIAGSFDRGRFNDILRNAGLNEAGYIDVRRKEEVRDQIQSTLGNAVSVPQPMVEALYRYREETRVAKFVTIDAEKFGKVADPDDAKLKTYFDANKDRFKAPAYRKLNVLILSGTDVKKIIPVKDEDLAAHYEQQKARFDIPEKRQIEQIAFKDADTAKKAAEAIKGGKSFADVAKEAGAKDSDVKLGLLTKKEMIDEKIAEAAFKLAKDAVSDPVEGLFTTVLVRVTEIQPGRVKPMAEVRDQLKDELAAQKLSQEVQALYDKVDNERLSGRTLKEISDKLKLRFVEIAEADATGRTPEGKPAFDHPDAVKILRQAFEGNIGLDSEPVELSDSGYAWFNILGVTPERQKTLEEAKADVTKSYLESERNQALSAAAEKLVERLGKGEAFDAIAKDAGGKPDETKAIKRSETPQGLTPDMVRQIFALTKNKAGMNTTSDGKSRTVFLVTDVKAAAAPTTEQMKAISDELQPTLRDDTLTSYLTGLQDRLGVSVNQSVLMRALGVEREG